MYIRIVARGCVAGRRCDGLSSAFCLASIGCAESWETGRSGTVYLAYHVELEEYRAVKVVPKSLADYDTFRKEALFLKTLRHPGIPIVYDVRKIPDTVI